MTYTIPLTARRSSTRGNPWANGKYGEIRVIWRSLSRNRSPIQSLLKRRL
jgi:hypothetical protein